MSISLYDISAGSYLQVLPAVERFLAKGAEHLAAEGVDLESVVATRLFEDMLPFHFQIVSVVHHSMGAIKAIESGEFSPPAGYPECDYAGLQKLVSDAKATIEGYSSDQINGFDGNDVIFKIGGREMPFTASGFILSFSLPNFYFHAATTYDILRMKGVPLGKRDFMGQMRMKG